jgi:hypothetical protein
MIKRKEKESSDGLKDNCILDNGEMEKNMEWGFGALQMVTATWVNGKTELLRDKEFIVAKMDKNMKGALKIF